MEKAEVVIVSVERKMVETEFSFVDLELQIQHVDLSLKMALMVVGVVDVEADVVQLFL